MRSKQILRILICCLLTVFILCGCTGQDSGDSTVSDASADQSSDNSTASPPDASDYLSTGSEPDEVTGDMAGYITLTTDKSEYSTDDTLKLSIVCDDETDEVSYGMGFVFQCWDEQTKKWRSLSKGLDGIPEIAMILRGSAEHDIVLSERIVPGYTKYRIYQKFSTKEGVLVFFSNEFTVN